MNAAAFIPFFTIPLEDEEDSMAYYSSRSELEDALDMYNAASGTALSEEALESLADYLSAHADYINGLWDTGATLTIDTIDEDTFNDLIIAADNGEL